MTAVAKYSLQEQAAANEWQGELALEEASRQKYALADGGGLGDINAAGCPTDGLQNLTATVL